METRSYLSDLTIANVDFLAVELVALWVLPALDDFTDSDVQLGDIRHVGSLLGSLLSTLRLRLLLLLLFLGGLLRLFLSCSFLLGSLRLFCLLLLLLRFFLGCIVSILTLLCLSLFFCLSLLHLFELPL